MPGTSDATDAKARLRERFICEWQGAATPQERPCIAAYVDDVTEADKTELFCELLALDLQFRLEQREQPAPGDYCSVRGGSTDLILNVFARRGLGGATRRPGGGTDPDHTVTYAREHDSQRGQNPSAATAPTGESGARRAAPTLPAIEGYEILGELGRGGMGVVYKARDLRLQRLVALKTLLPGRPLSAARMERFLLEARAVARLQHPHVVQIYEIGEQRDQPYLALELVEGKSLHQQLAGAPQAPSAAAALVATLARTVAYAHDKEIVHRDLKPSNILVTSDGTPKIADFGLAKPLDQANDRREAGDIIGTPSYMAPEQAWGKADETGPAADIYALGVILYEMLTGRPPFHGADRGQTIALVRHQEPVPPRRLVPQVPRDLELICLKCLGKEPGQRFASARELADELQRFREGRSIRTRPAPWWEEVWRWCRRQPATAALVVVAAAALLSALLYLDQRARSVQRELREQERVAALRDEVRQLHLRADQAAVQGERARAQAELQAALALLATEPSLADLKGPLDALGADLARREDEQQGRAAAAEAYRAFFAARDTALFHGMVFTGVDLGAKVAPTVKACAEALALFGVRPEGAGIVLPSFLDARQRQDIAEGCYELLLVWADAVAQAPPERQGTTAAQLEQALRLLDRAARLDLPVTAAFHWRRTAYLDALGQAGAARQARLEAGKLELRGAIDHFLIGDACQKREQHDVAAHHFVQALRAQPDHFWARYFLAVCDLQRQRPAEARDNLTSCMSQRPDFAWLYLFRGFANGQLNDFASAQADYDRALALQDDAQAAYGVRVNQGVLALRQARLGEWLMPLPWSAGLGPNCDWASRGIAAAYRCERLAHAARHLDAAVHLQPEQYPAYRYQAQLAQQQQRFAEALDLLGRALEAARSQPPAIRAQLYGQRARLQRERRDVDAALADLEQALELWPSAQDHAERGRLLHAKLRHVEAIAAYDAALQLRPSEPDVWRWKGEALMAARRPGDAEAAVAAFDQYLALDGRPSADVHRRRAQLRAGQRRFTEALADYSRALTLQPDAGTYAARAWLLFGHDLPAPALEDFEEALRHDPEHAFAYAGRGLIRALRSSTGSALADAHAALRHGQPQTPLLLWNVAHIYAQLAVADAGRASHYQEQALELLRRALARLPVLERQAFWRQYVERDRLLAPLHGNAGFARLQRDFGVTTTRGQ